MMANVVAKTGDEDSSRLRLHNVVDLDYSANIIHHNVVNDCNILYISMWLSKKMLIISKSLE